MCLVKGFIFLPVPFYEMGKKWISFLWHEDCWMIRRTMQNTKNKEMSWRKSVTKKTRRRNRAGSLHSAAAASTQNAASTSTSADCTASCASARKAGWESEERRVSSRIAIVAYTDEGNVKLTINATFVPKHQKNHVNTGKKNFLRKMTQYMNGIYRNGMKTSCTGLIGRRKLAFVEKVQVGQEQVLIRMIVPFQLPGQIFRFGRDVSITSRQGIIPTNFFDGIKRMILFCPAVFGHFSPAPINTDFAYESPINQSINQPSLLDNTVFAARTGLYGVDEGRSRRPSWDPAWTWSLVRKLIKKEKNPKKSLAKKKCSEKLMKKKLKWRLIGWLVDWLIGWLVDWLIGWLVCDCHSGKRTGIVR